MSGTRILASTVLSYLQHGSSAEDIFRDYPSLPVDGVDAVIRWAEATYGVDWKFHGMPPFSLEHYDSTATPTRPTKNMPPGARCSSTLARRIRDRPEHDNGDPRCTPSRRLRSSSRSNKRFDGGTLSPSDYIACGEIECWRKDPDGGRHLPHLMKGVVECHRPRRPGERMLCGLSSASQ